MTYYAGRDVSLRSTHICVIDDDGELLAEGRTDSEVADIIAFIDELDGEITEVGLEAGTLCHAQQDGQERRAWYRATAQERLVQPRPRQERREPPGASVFGQP